MITVNVVVFVIVMVFVVLLIGLSVWLNLYLYNKTQVLEKQKETLSAKFEKKVIFVNKLKKQNKQLQESIIDLKETYEKDKKSFADKVAIFEQESNALQSQITKTESLVQEKEEKLKDLQNKITETESLVQEKENNIDELIKKIKRLESECEKLTEISNDFSKAKTNLVLSQRKIEQISSNVEKVCISLSSLTENVSVQYRQQVISESINILKQFII